MRFTALVGLTVTIGGLFLLYRYLPFWGVIGIQLMLIGNRISYHYNAYTEEEKV